MQVGGRVEMSPLKMYVLHGGAIFRCLDGYISVL